jgi:hypothetical protein
LKAIRKLKTLLKHDAIRLYSSVVSATEESVYFSDGFSLLKLNNRYGMDGQYDKDGLNKLLVGVDSPLRNDKPLPNYESVIPDKSSKIEINLNAQILSQLCNVLSAESKSKVITLKITDEEYPITLVNDYSDIGVIIPVKK